MYNIVRYDKFRKFGKPFDVYSFYAAVVRRAGF